MICNNCNKPTVSLHKGNQQCPDCKYGAHIENNQVFQIDVWIDKTKFHFSAFNGNPYSYMLFNFEYIPLNYIFFPNIKDNIIEAKEFLQRINKIMVLK